MSTRENLENDDIRPQEQVSGTPRARKACLAAAGGIALLAGCSSLHNSGNTAGITSGPTYTDTPSHAGKPSNDPTQERLKFEQACQSAFNILDKPTILGPLDGNAAVAGNTCYINTQYGRLIINKRLGAYNTPPRRDAVGNTFLSEAGASAELWSHDGIAVQATVADGSDHLQVDLTPGKGGGDQLQQQPLALKIAEMAVADIADGLIASTPSA